MGEAQLIGGAGRVAVVLGFSLTKIKFGLTLGLLFHLLDAGDAGLLFLTALLLDGLLSSGKPFEDAAPAAHESGAKSASATLHLFDRVGHEFAGDLFAQTFQHRGGLWRLGLLHVCRNRRRTRQRWQGLLLLLLLERVHCQVP